MDYGFLLILLILALFYLYFARKEYLRESYLDLTALTKKPTLPQIKSPYH